MSTQQAVPQVNWSEIRSDFSAWVRTSPAAWAILLANVVPLVGTILFAWDAFEVVFVYWLENLLIGGFYVLKMVFAHGGASSYVELYRRQPGMLILLPVLVAFFVFHYGGFCYGHGIFVFVVFDRAPVPHRGELADWVQAELTLAMAVSLAALAVEHAYAFYRDFWKRGDYQRYPFIMYMIAPYGRIALVHCVLLFGGALAHLLGSPTIVVVFLIALKVGPELLTVWIGQSTRQSNPLSFQFVAD